MTSADDPRFYRLHHASSVQGSPRSHPGLPMTPPKLDHDGHLFHGNDDVATDLDRLVHRLNKKPIFQDSLRWRFREEERRERNVEWIPEENGFRSGQRLDVLAKTATMQMQPQPQSQPQQQPQSLESTPTLDPIPEFSLQYDPYPATTPPLCEPLHPLVPYNLDSLAPTPPSSDKLPSRTCDVKRPRRATDVRLHKSASNLRMLGLVTDMIENGVQCKVQNSTPSSPTKASWTSSPMPPAMRYIEPQDAVDPQSLPECMELEVDMGFGELDEATLLNDNLALRHASAPAGVRKYGLLRYRTSSEAAQSCKNMKKSVPRMRRRRRPDTPASSGTPAPKPSATTV